MNKKAMIGSEVVDTFGLVWAKPTSSCMFTLLISTFERKLETASRPYQKMNYGRVMETMNRVVVGHMSVLECDNISQVH